MAPSTSPFRRLPRPFWTRGYDRALLAADTRAGLVVGVLLLPQGMAYATLAGLPPITGLYASIVSLLVYALLGTSNHSSVAPAALDSLLVAAAVAPLAHGDPARYVALAGLLAMLAGTLQIGAGVLRLGNLVSFVSAPVISGFTTAAALTIAAGQLPALLGVPVGGGTVTLADTAAAVAPRLGEIHPATATVGVLAVAVLVALRGRSTRIPGPLLVVGLAGAAVALLPALHGVALLGPVPSGLPSPILPVPPDGDVLADARALLPSAAALALVSYLESISTATTFARRTRSRVRPNGELFAVGAANLACGLFRGFNVAGGFSRAAVNVQAGARTPMSGVVAAGMIVVSLLTIAPLFAALPRTALAAVIIMAVLSLVDLRGAAAIGRVSLRDLAALIGTFVATVGLGPVAGLGVGVAMSLVMFLRQSANPHLPELGRLPDTAVFRNLRRYPRAHTDPAAVLFRLDAPLYFANCQMLLRTVRTTLAERPALRGLVLDAGCMPWIDYSGTETLAELDVTLAEAGVTLHLAAARGPVVDVLARDPGVARLIDDGRLHTDVASAVAALDLSPGSALRCTPDASPGPVHGPEDTSIR